MLKLWASLVILLVAAVPLSAQETVPRPSPREGPDTACAPSYGSKPFADSAVPVAKAPDTGRVVSRDMRPPCPVVSPSAVTPAPPANAQVAPLSAKSDSLRQQADSASRRPKN